MTAAAYYSIPLALGYFAHKRREDIPFTWLFVLFGAFILLCGTTHLFGIWTLFVPDYYSQGILKAATGLASIGTAIVVWRLMPALLLLPGPEKLRKLNTELETLVASRTQELRAALTEKDALLSQAYHRAAIVQSSEDAIIAYDLEGRVTEWNPAAETLFGIDASDAVGSSIEDGRFKDFVLAEDFAALFRAACSGDHIQTQEISRTRGRRLDVSITVSTIRDAAGTMQGVSFIARDVSERYRDQERMRVATLEVDHRAKNMLAVVMAMINMTEHDPACDGFVEKIRGRIEALSASHSAVVDNKWDGALLSDLFQRTLKPFAAKQTLRIEGDDVFLAPVAVQALGIVLHELGTNALKYGALSAPRGTILLSTDRRSDGEVTIVWTERGGPRPLDVTRRSFGMRLITRHIADQLEGDTDIAWTDDGLQATIGVPSRHVVDRGRAGA